MKHTFSTRLLALLLVGCLAIPAGAQPADKPARRRPVPAHVSLEAIRHKQAAEALLAEAKPAEAAVAIGQAVKLAPDWPEAYLVSARVQLAVAGPESEVSALAQPKAGVDYAAMLAALRGAARDLETFLRLAPQDPEAAEATALVGVIASRIALCLQISRGAAERAAREEEEQRRRAAEEAARAQAEELRRRQAEEAARQTVVDTERQQGERVLALRLTQDEADRVRAPRRRSAIVLLSIGAVLGVTAGVFAYLGGATNDRVKKGGFRTSGDIARELDKGQAYNWTAIASASLAGVFVAIGTPLLLFNLKVGPARVALAPSLAAPGAAVTVVLP